MGSVAHRDWASPYRSTNRGMNMVEHQPGKLTIYLGYAAAVGKTYVMLEEAHKRKTDGADIVIGYFEPHSRKETIAKAEGLEMIPKRNICYHGVVLQEMDTDAVLARRPQICIVDELPHSNVPGSKHAKRWQDIEELLAHGIDVWTSMNIQHLHSLNEQVWRISAVRVHETVPDRILRQVDRIVLVDITPKSLLSRLQEGTVFDRNQVQRAFQHFFREPTLAALRELALRQLEYRVESQIVKTDQLAPTDDPVSHPGATAMKPLF